MTEDLKMVRIKVLMRFHDNAMDKEIFFSFFQREQLYCIFYLYKKGHIKQKTHQVKCCCGPGDKEGSDRPLQALLGDKESGESAEKIGRKSGYFCDIL